MMHSKYHYAVANSQAANFTVVQGVEGLMNAIAVTPNVKLCFPLIKEKEAMKKIEPYSNELNEFLET